MPAVAMKSIASWQEQASREVIPVRCSSPDARFAGRLAALRLDSHVSVFSIASDPIHVEYSTRGSAGHADYLLFSLQLSSTAVVTQHHRSVRVAPHTATLNDTRYPFIVDQLRPGSSHAVIRVDRDRLGLREHEIAGACARLLDRRSAGFHALTGLLQGLLDRHMEQSASIGALSQAAISLCSAVVRSTQEYDSGWDDDSSLLAAAKANVLQHMTDPDLTVERLARTCLVSVRKLHRVFADAGETPSAFIRRVRLERAQQLLRDRDRAGRSIASISALCGYTDPATFNRAFKREHGVSPSRWAA